MDDYQPLACDLYDYLEIACMHRYQLAIELVDGSHLLGQALTTQTTAKEEFLLIRTSDGEQRLRIGNHPTGCRRQLWSGAVER